MASQPYFGVPPWLLSAYILQDSLKSQLQHIDALLNTLQTCEASLHDLRDRRDVFQTMLSKLQKMTADYNQIGTLITNDVLITFLKAKHASSFPKIQTAVIRSSRSAPPLSLQQLSAQALKHASATPIMRQMAALMADEFRCLCDDIALQTQRCSL